VPATTEIWHVLKQLLISLVVIVAAAAAYILLVPGAPQSLARIGITLPTAPASDGAPAARPGGGRAPMGGGGRALVIVTAPVTVATINDRLTAIGEAAAAQSVTVTSPASGTLTELLVAPGDVVQAGTVIARLDADAEEIAARRADLALKDAEATLARTQELAKANAATTVQLTTVQLAADNARLEAENAALALKRRSISTPVGGTVGLFQVTEGNAVTAQSVVTTVVDTSHLLVSFWAPERYADVIRTGLPVAVSAVALAGDAITGEVTALDNRVDSTSRTLQVQARIPNADGRLRPGMSFSVAMNFAGETFPSVDPLAIQWSSEGAYVWGYADGKVERVPVHIIQRNSDGVLVQGALAAGDEVVTQGVQQLTAGASVRLLDEVGSESGQPGRQGEAQAPLPRPGG